MDTDTHDETYIVMDVDTAKKNDQYEEELQVTLLMITRHLNRRQPQVFDRHINEISYDLWSRSLVILRGFANTPFIVFVKRNDTSMECV